MTGKIAALHLAGTPILVPDWSEHEADDWQRHWAAMLPGAVRVAAPRDHKTLGADWTAAIDCAIGWAHGSVLIAAHGAGCIAVAWWAAAAGGIVRRVRGALLVAPRDVDGLSVPAALRTLIPAPQLPLPFPSLVIASSDDPHCPLAGARVIARQWDAAFAAIGVAGHIDLASGHQHWREGIALLQRVDRSPSASFTPEHRAS